MTTSFRWLAILAILLAAGCAPAYHSYSGCRIKCRYCPPPPLPHANFNDCVCHSCAASNYLVNKIPTAAATSYDDDIGGDSVE